MFYKFIFSCLNNKQYVTVITIILNTWCNNKAKVGCIVGGILFIHCRLYLIVSVYYHVSMRLSLDCELSDPSRSGSKCRSLSSFKSTTVEVGSFG